MNDNAHLRERIETLRAEVRRTGDSDATRWRMLGVLDDLLALLDTPPPASPRQGEPVALDVAWRAVEDALPDGWQFVELKVRPEGWRSDIPRVFARARLDPYVSRDGRVNEVGEHADTPGEALFALAAALSPDPAEPVAPDKEGNG